MGQPLPFVNLARSVAGNRDALEAALRAVLDSGWFVLGEQGAEFEREFASWCGAEEAVAVASGTDAIELALRALDIGAGDEVVTQANTCVPTVAAIERAGALPRLCDVETAAATMDPVSLEAAISDRTKAVIPVHLYGQCAEMEAISAVTEGAGVVVIEDCAQAHGARLGARPAGTMGALGCFSFYPTKNLGALGDAGALTTNDESLAARVRSLRNYGQADRYRHLEHGVNSRMDELQAALLRVKLPLLADHNERRRVIAGIYADVLAESQVKPLAQLPGRVHVFHQFVVTVPDRDGFRRRMEEAGVATLIHYPYPIHRHPPYRELAGQVSLANSETLAESIVSLPLYPELSDDEALRVAETARACI